MILKGVTLVAAMKTAGYDIDSVVGSGYVAELLEQNAAIDLSVYEIVKVGTRTVTGDLCYMTHGFDPIILHGVVLSTNRLIIRPKTATATTTIYRCACGRDADVGHNCWWCGSPQKGQT